MNKLPVASVPKSSRCSARGHRCGRCPSWPIYRSTPVDAGRLCAAFHDDQVRGVKASRVQVDEIWSFTYAKAKNVPNAKKAPAGAGDTWTWTGLGGRAARRRPPGPRAARLSRGSSGCRVPAVPAVFRRAPVSGRPRLQPTLLPDAPAHLSRARAPRDVSQHAAAGAAGCGGSPRRPEALSALAGRPRSSPPRRSARRPPDRRCATPCASGGWGCRCGGRLAGYWDHGAPTPRPTAKALFK